MYRPQNHVMKFHKILVLSMVLFGGITLTVVPVQESKAHNIAEMVKDAIESVIRAFDLMIQRLQNEKIWLQNAQKVIENTLSDLKLKEIGQWTQKQRDLYKKYYDDLWKVRTAIANYQRIQQLINKQVMLVQAYRISWDMVSRDNHFTKDEIQYMYTVYSGILHQSVLSLDQVLLMVNAMKLQLADAKRLEEINKAGDAIDQQYNDLRKFNAQNIALSLSRAKDSYEIQTIKQLYGIK